jgi:hypothetical protein
VLLRCAAALLALGSCGPDYPSPQKHPPCVATQLGDANAPIALQIISLASNGTAVTLNDGDSVRLTPPSQGGFVLYAGARATNLMSCNGSTSAELLDASGTALTNLDQRSTDFVLQVGDFYGPYVDEMTYQVANIPACPDHLGRGVVGQPAFLQVTVTDAKGKTATAKIKVVPSCDSDFCNCACGPNYTPGKC